MNAIRRILLLIAVLAVSPGPVSRAADPDSPTAETVRLRTFVADRILDGLDGRDWLVSGSLDDEKQVLIRRAAERGMPLTLVDRPLALLPEETQAKLRELGEELAEAAGISPYFFARTWMGSAPDEARAHLAMLDGQEIWRSSSYNYVPSGLVFLGALNAEASREGLDARYEAAEEAWDEAGEFLLDSESGPSSPEGAELRQVLRWRLARSANELGALLESAGMEDKAMEAYTRAYRFDSANVSALMNRASLVKQGRMPGLQDEIVSELNRHNADTEGARNRWALATMFGPVAHPEDFVPMGWPWALSGIPVSERARLEAAIESVSEADRPAILRTLAEGWNRQTRGTDQAKRILGELREPASRAKMALALMREATPGDETGTLHDYWADVARKAGAPDMDLLLADVSIALGARDLDKATALLEEGLRKEPGNLNLWRILVSLQEGRGNVAGLRRSVAAIGLLKGQTSSLLPYAKGALAKAEGRFEEARTLLQEALEGAPGDVTVLEPLLKLDMQVGGPPAAKAHAEAMLKVKPEHAFAQYILGSVAYAAGDYETAASHLGRSVAVDAQPYALNDYACALSGMGRYQEAAHAIVAALQQSPDNPAMLDTYAEALIGLEKWDEAEKTVAKAAAAAAGGGGQGLSGVFLLRMAQIRLHKGDREGAAAALRETEPFRKDFGAAEKKLFDDIERALAEPALPELP